MTALTSARRGRITGGWLGALRSRFTAVSRRGWGILRPGVDRVRPWVAAVTPLGWAVTGGAGACLVAGLVEGWVEVLVLGVALTLIVVLALMWTFGRMSYAARIDLDTPRVTAGDDAHGRVLVRNEVMRSLVPARVELTVGRGRSVFDLPALAKGEEHELLFLVPTRRRAVIAVGPLRSVKADPIGLFKRERRWAERTDLYVNPRTIPIGLSMAGFLRDIEGVTSHNLTSSDVAFHALREYVDGDDLRTVHWRTTARTGRLMVRQFEETRRSHLLVLLSLRPDDYADLDQFELAVSTAGSLVLQAKREQRQVELMTSVGRLSTRSGPGVLDQLSSVGLQASAAPLRQTLTLALAEVPSTSMVVIVTGGAVTAGTLHSASLVAPLDLMTVGIRALGQDDPRARRRVGALTILDVPSLEELPRMLGTIR